MVSGSWPAFLSSVLQYPIVVCLAFLCWSEISGAGQPIHNCLVNLLLSILSMCPILIKCRFSIFSSILSMVNCFLTPNIFILFSCISLIGGLSLLAHIYRYNLSISLCNLFITDLYHGRTTVSNSAVDSTHVCATIACWRFESLVFFSLFLTINAALRIRWRRMVRSIFLSAYEPEFLCHLLMIWVTYFLKTA